MAQPEQLPPATGRRWLTPQGVIAGSLVVLSTLAVVGVFLIGLSPGGLTGGLAGMRDRMAGATGDGDTLPGFLSIEPPQVYTRERLVNDRFREATWLNLQLEATHAPEDRNRFAQASVAQQRARSTTGTLTVGATAAPATAASVSPTQAAQLDELALFQRRTVYRERLRNDLMDTLLDDGHDLDGNTLYRLNFDTVVLPWADRTRDPGTAIYVITARSPYALLQNAQIRQRRIDDDIDLLRSWQREIQVFLSEVLTLRKQSFEQQGTLINPVDPKENITFDWYLRTTLIEQFLRLAAKGGTSGACDTPLDAPPCPHWSGNVIWPTQTAQRRLHQRMNDVAKWTGLMWRDDLRTPEAVSPEFINGMLNSLATAQAVNEVRALSAPVILSERTSPNERPPNRNLRFDQRTLQQLSDPEQKRALMRLLATLDAMEKALPIYAQRGGTGALPSHLEMPASQPGARPPSLNSYLGRFGRIVPGDREILAYRDELDARKTRAIATETALRQDANAPLPPPDTTPPHTVCLQAPTLFDFGRCMFLRGSTTAFSDKLLAEFLLARLTNDLTAYETLEQPITAFLDVRLSGCDTTGCKIEVRQYPGLTPNSAGLTPFSIAEDDAGVKHVDPFAAMKVDPDASHAAGGPVVRLTQPNIDALRQALSRAPNVRQDVMTCLSLAEASLGADRRVTASEVYLACMLRQWVETRRNDLAVYGVSPRIGGTVVQSAQTGTVDLNTAATTPGATITAGTSEATSQTARQVATTVIGFSQMPLGTETSGRSGFTSRAQDEALFGWAIRPPRAPDGVHWAPSHNRLSAVVAVPSWWKWLEFEVRACWITPGRARALAATLHADPRGICLGTGPGADGLNAPPLPILQRYFQVQLPRRVEDVTERFNFDFIKAPYFDRDWDENIQQNPALVTLEVGRPGRLVLAGERLWRGTVVTVNNQNADGIVVLPDMKGVVAEFRCVQPSPGRLHMVTEATDKPTRPDVVPMLVWTSEGRTQVRQVYLQPFIKRTPTDAPCTDPLAYRAAPKGTQGTDPVNKAAQD